MEPNQPWEQAILKKKLDHNDQVDGTISLRFKPSDTMCLLPGLYYYQVKIRLFEDGEAIVNTIIPKTHFWIEE